jgi:carbonic anhydrase
MKMQLQKLVLFISKWTTSKIVFIWQINLEFHCMPIIGNPITFSDNFWTENAEGEFFNNGHTVEFKVDLPNEYNFTGGPFGDEEYQFLQLHFHWGSVDTRGSEHTIRGKQFPMEMHMVCINSKYIVNDTVDDAYLTNPDGVAVLGFMFKLGEKEFVPLMNITDGISGLQSNETATRSDDEPSVPLELNLASLFEGVFWRGYYTYSGSFTTPGCNEVVTWVNFKKPIEISKEQLEMYRSLTDSDGKPIVDNFRPTQNIAGRAVKKGIAVWIS